MTHTVKAKDVVGWNMTLLQLIGIGPKLTITCGSCSGTFRKRVPPGVNSPGIACRHCHAINVLPIQWEAPMP